MSKSSWSQSLVVAFSVGALIVSGINWSQRQEAGAVSPVKTAQEVSSSFRQVAAEITPSVVKISTKSKPREVAMEDNPLMDENSPFRDFFRNDPRFKEMFKNPGQRQRVPM